MSGMALPLGGEITIQWMGETVVLPPFTLRDFATVEHELLKRKREKKLATIAILREHISEEAYLQQVTQVRRECEELSVTAEEMQDWMDATREGVCFTLWILLNRKYPGKYNLEAMEEQIFKQSEEAILRLIEARDQASGLDVAGNEDGSPAVAQQPEVPGQQTGK